MANRLKNILTFPSVAVGATVTQAHDLNVNEADVAPDLCAPDTAGFTIVATSTTVSVTNNGPVPTSVGVYVEHWHTIERVFGTGFPDLAGTPFNLGAALTTIVTSGILPGPNKASEINAAIAIASAEAIIDDCTHTVQLLEGEYELEAPIILASGVILQGMGDCTILIPTYTGGADDPDNHVIGIVGELDLGTLNTTLTAIAPKNSRSITVASAGSIGPGTYLLLQGVNPQPLNGDAFLESSAESLSEVLQVAASYAGGLVIPLTWPSQQHHGSLLVPITVQAVIPPVRCGVKKLAIRGSENGVITAVGVFGRYAIRVSVEDLTASGLSRAAINMFGVGEYRERNFYSKGTNNAWTILQSPVGFDVRGFNGATGVPRVHPQGFPRNPILLNMRPTAGFVGDGCLTGTALGMFTAGGEHIAYANILIRDVEITQDTYDRWCTSGEQGNGGRATLGFGFGYGPLDRAAFAFGIQATNIQVMDIVAPNTAFWTGTPGRANCFYLHDVLQGQFTNLFCTNRGASISSVAGVILSDIIAEITNLFVAGYSFGLMTENVLLTVWIRNYNYGGVSGTAPNSTVPLFLNHHQSPASQFRITQATFTNAFSNIRFGSSYTFDPGFMIQDLSTDSGEWSYVVAADNQTGVPFTSGDTVEIDPTYGGPEIRVRTPIAGPNLARRLALVATAGLDDPGVGPITIAPLPQRRATAIIAAGSAVAFGDTLEYVATRRMQTNNAATIGLGMAMEIKTTVVAEQKIRIGTVTG